MENVMPAPAIPPPAPTPEPQIAGFWQRVLGLLVDGLLLGLIGMLLGLIFWDMFVRFGPWGRLVGFVIAMLYFVPMNSRMFGGQTVGKRLVGSRVVNRNGRPVSLSRSTARYLILAVPYFLNNAIVPVSIIFSWIGTVFGILTLGFGCATIYLIIFNRRTRQSLHDIVAGTFVVKRSSGEAPLRKTTWPGHLLVVGLLIVVFAALPRLLAPLINNSFFKPLLIAADHIERECHVTVRTITQGFVQTYGAKTSRRQILTVSVVSPNKPSDYGAFANNIAAVVIRDVPSARDVDIISVGTAYGYDIGISSWWSIHRLSYPPAEWQKRLQASQ
jgi:uncharacterized RDD family membrane protein YckC